jgi:hypothetical protein
MSKPAPTPLPARTIAEAVDRLIHYAAVERRGHASPHGKDIEIVLSALVAASSQKEELDRVRGELREARSLLDDGYGVNVGLAAARARADAIEDAAKVADETAGRHNKSDYDAGWNYACELIGDRIRALSSRPVEAGTTDPWCYDMEKAPKDGAVVLLYWPTMSITRYPAVGVNHGDGYGWNLINDRDYGEVFPTAWTPCPPSPRPPAIGEVTR